MIAHKKEFWGGFFMLAAFVVVLVLMFSPLFKGHNALAYLDSLYNSISKHSAYYIPAVREEAEDFSETSVSVTLDMDDEERARQTALLFMKADAMVNTSGSELKVTGDLGEILVSCLSDAKDMYYNRGEKISQKYGYDERRVLLNWWLALSRTEKSLNNQKQFKEAKMVSLVQKKAVEMSYNYYTIEPQAIGDRMGIVGFSLAFYVIYTLWYGFAIMFMFEGWGLRLEH